MPVGQKPQLNLPGLGELHYNPLQQYRNVTYNVRLSMMPASDGKMAREARSYNYKIGIVMLETGGTGSVNLEELTMKMVGAGNQTPNFNMVPPHEIKMKLVEPLGGRFIESLSIAAIKQNYITNPDAIYLLEVWFTGYDDDDNPVVCKNWGGGPLEFRWYVVMTELKMQLDYRGSVYDLEFVSSEGQANLGDFMSLEQGFRMVGSPSTIGEFCKELETALNKREEDKVKAGLREHPHKYKITAHRDLVNLKYDYSLFSRVTTLFGMFRGEIQVSNATSIPRFITNQMPNSKEVLKYLHRVDDGKKIYNVPDTNPNTINKPTRNIVCIAGSKFQEQGSGYLFDTKLNAPAQEINFFVYARTDSKSFISPQEYIDAYEASQRNGRVQVWLDQGLLRKAYKWIYTGENTEVINAELKIDNLWRAVRPLWIDTESGKIIAPGAATPPAQRRPPGQRENPPTSNQARQPQPNTWAAAGQTLYAEDLPARPGKPEDNPHIRWRPQFYHANTAVQQSGTQSAVSEENAHEYSIFKQIHGQVGAGSQDMVNLDLDVVGDPYFLMQEPSESGKSPWQDDVWWFEKNYVSEEQLKDKRKYTATRTNQPYIWFEAQVPAADLNDQDLMNLRPADAITGIYCVKEVAHTFQKGKFVTKLSTFREVLANPYDVRSPRSSSSIANSGGQANNGAGQASATGPNSAWVQNGGGETPLVDPNNPSAGGGAATGNPNLARQGDRVRENQRRRREEAERERQQRRNRQNGTNSSGSAPGIGDIIAP